MGLSQVTGYVDQSVVLKSGADPSWKLLKIQWSIYSNTTYIITCVNGKIENRYWRYQGRLTLNQSSGDLEIHNLTAEDSMTYTVSLLSDEFQPHENHIELSVQESLKKPVISVLFSSLVHEYCIIALKCSSSENNVNLSWTPKDGFNKPYWNGTLTQNSSELWTSFKPNRNVTFTCTATDIIRKSSDHHTVSCAGECVPSLPRQMRGNVL
ncbi:hypothetical protein NFI96_021190 [Prochilodus magdalenae]|nr:hypothetical protein NFI96_021190 [Prochilodus magdalenae]